MSKTVIERIAAMSQPSIEKFGCVDFTGRKDRGYGRVKVAGRLKYAHRVMLEHRLGRELVHGEIARHKCDRPSCVNPAHLIPGSHQDNSDDKEARGRMKGAAEKAAMIGTVKDLWSAGFIAREIYLVVDVSHQTVSRWIKEEGFKPNPMSMARRLRIQRTKDMIAGGSSRAEVMDATGISPGTLRHHLRINLDAEYNRVGQLLQSCGTGQDVSL